MRIAIALVVMVTTIVCLAQDKPATTQPAIPGIDPAGMAQMAAIMSPGPGHDYLKKMVGNYKTVTRFWFAPNTPPQTSEGTATWSLIMDGRFAKQETKGTAMGQPFTGLSLVGFNNFTGEYESLWIDSMGTSMTTTRGKPAADGKSVTLTGTMTDPMTGQPTKIREVAAIVSEDQLKYEMYVAGPDGKEFVMVEVISNRVK